MLATKLIRARMSLVASIGGVNGPPLVGGGIIEPPGSSLAALRLKAQGQTGMRQIGGEKKVVGLKKAYETKK